MADCQFIAFHGWGFDDLYWRSWDKILSKYGTFKTYDRGYFNEGKEVETVDRSTSTVLITHSFGLHWITEDLLNQADLLVITGGFLYFHPYTAQHRRRSRLIVQEMIKALESNPQKVLRDFYDKCFAPQDTPENNFEDINQQLLLDDLQTLQNAELDTEILKNAQKICILHGSKDQVVPNKKGRQIYTQLQAKAQYFEIKKAGHALPFTHYKQCLEFVKPEIMQLVKTNF